MIELIATVESIPQAKALLEAGVDCLYFGEDEFGLRLPYSFTRDEQRALVELAHTHGKKVSIAVNAIFHNDRIVKIADYLRFLKELAVDSITVGDPGVIQIMRRDDLWIPYRYDAQVIVTSSKQINFWAKRGAVAAVLAREIPQVSLEKLMQDVAIPVEFLVYGATCIHQSGRPLLQNYFNYIKKTESVGRDRGLFLSEPRKEHTHYSVYEDRNGTHIFANNDVLMALHLDELTKMNITQWKLEGVFSPGNNFVEIARLFARARDAIQAGKWTSERAQALAEQVRQLHPTVRGLDTGFYLFDPNLVK
ncbi:U32 family peptidase [Aerococcaceae bacterium NML210727]|nr:U32 family peptidase [Aerococcaceae bacterium NML210727]MCW6653984.1 U32 family peptidase [Aerococcaceae bacterium NML201296]MCW6660881.1 U32 family peptidase [Aerococcaceae bacterium NML201209]MCW6674784.1 U32 family peptidase [Aerococcaceae bacterium NML171108]MCW6676368.1 U32 family peptidase [Aerococcaceae bacterium NML180378]MCW6679941.1 U32 family peptidase [Aerococcaceae bacterium NML130460]MCW6681665.1 U32 family peptidase [Aerococcaceae bacterium NML160702]